MEDMENRLTGNRRNDLGAKATEDIALIDCIDRFFRMKRGYVVQMPAPGTPVGVCMSGGLDSVSTIAALLENFQLRVYPFFIDRGQSNLAFEREAMLFYNGYFKRRYPELYTDCFTIKTDIPSLSYKHMLTEELKRGHIDYPARNSMLFLAGAEYLYSLKSTGVVIKTLFGATVASDDLYHCSLTWTRVTNLAICQFLNDYDWQMMSLAIERELGNYYDKDVLIRYCAQIGVPLDHTRTCVGSDPVQCGRCVCCRDRRRCFREAGVEDKTSYLNS